MGKEKTKKDGLIRILQYIGSLETGGSQSMIMNYYRNIDRSKIQFDFVVDRSGKDDLFYKDEIESLGGKVYVFDEYFKGYNYFRFAKQWKTFFKNHSEYKIIHCHVRSVASIVLRIAKEFKLKTICHSHNTSNGSGVKAIVKKILQGRIKNSCDYFFACSKESARWLYGNNIAESDKCMIINNAIESKRYKFNSKTRERVRDELGLGNKIILGQVGRIETVKNYGFTLMLLKMLLKNDAKYHLLVVGTGSLKERFIEEARHLDIYSNITILENRSDVPDLLQAMDVFVMPSLYEGLPVSLVEAQAAGLPCVVSNNVKDGILINDSVKKISLDDIEEWEKTINNYVFLTRGMRKDNTGIIKKNGFDVVANVQILSCFYNNVFWERGKNG